MPFDCKKECREFCMPPKKPAIVGVPPMGYIAVRGKGDPNEEGGEFGRSMGKLYAAAFTIKMSRKGGRKELWRLTAPARRTSGGYLSSACPTSLMRTI
ncbi:MAG: hypothetical protein IKP20_05400 [Candidatus Methanomethylophilaceae archaeon]|nr:hypothetical protein [Candidatus Methanomethylophilaceae archaeon]